MKLPDNITLDWLKAPNAESYGVSNARVLVAEHQVGAVPKALIADFLGLMDETDGVTPLHDICLRGEGLAEVTDSLTDQLLTQAGTAPLSDGITPLDCACANGHEDEIPWSSLKARQWIGHLDLLRRCAQRIPTNNRKQDGGFFTFIKKVEKLKEISQL